MDRLKNILFWGGGIVLILIIFAFSGNEHKTLRTNGININIDYSKGLHFIDPDDVEQWVLDEYPFFDSLFLQEINIPLLEESLDNHPSIRKAEVYSKLDGSLRIDVYQKQPVARVQNYSAAFYIDEQGDSMALSSGFSARVPLVTGKIDVETQGKIYHFFRGLQSDEFYKDFFSGLKVEQNNEWVLYPKPGRHTVMLGIPEELEGKLKKLKSFYKNISAAENIDRVKTINLKYKDQVICRKY
ncbi:MAG: cell division protein FtsQ/DivIB [Owenweeksia sp.]